MKHVSTVRSRATGIGRKGLRFAVLGGVALLPILSMGVTVPSAVAVRDFKESRAASRERLDERNAVARKLTAYSDGSALLEIENLSAALHDMIPTGLRPLDEFGSIREASALEGIALRSIRLARTHATSITGESSGGSVGYAVVVDEVVVSLDETPETCLALIDDLRASGRPTVVLGFDLARTHLSQTTFQAELRLGFLRRVVRTQASGRTDMQQTP